MQCELCSYCMIFLVLLVRKVFETSTDTLTVLLTGYSAVAFDGASNYGHTPSHHPSQFANHSFKHEDSIAQPTNMGKLHFNYGLCVCVFMWVFYVLIFTSFWLTLSRVCLVTFSHLADTFIHNNLH